MELFPSDLSQLLDFPFIQREVARFCSSEEAKNRALNLGPFKEEDRLFRAIDECDQILALMLSEEQFPNAEHPSLKTFLSKLKVQGHALQEEQFGDIRSLVFNYAHLHRFVRNKVDRLPALWDRLDYLPPEKFIIEAIDKVLDERSKVRSNASPDLARIRRDLTRKRASADRIFQRVLKKYRDKGYIADFDESISESRRVLAISAAYKGQIQGILHGSSNKQSIAFIEPGETVEINNEIAELLEAEKEEIKRILRQLSSDLSPYHEHLETVEKAMVWLDFARAKAIFAYQQEACYPEILAERNIHIREAYNPVLRHFNKQKGKSTIPLNLSLDKSQRILVISGPNAGGKSLSLKTVGLLQLMLQSGLAVPVHPESKFSLFKQLFGDIGDAQSIENELSTYSSKLQKMEHFLTYTDSASLLLIDEFGSGSDPELGSALAQVFLDRLNAYGAFGIITTHFNAIKALAAEMEGVINGAMLFDQKSFDPRYELQIGQPGSSYTFEVAQRSGIPSHLIEDARSRVKQNTLEVDRLLVQIQEDKVAIEEVRSKQEAELKKLRKLERIQEERIKKLEEKVQKQSRINEEQDRLMYWGQRFQKLIDAWMAQTSQKDKKAVVARFIAMLNQRSGEVQKEDKLEHRKQVRKHHKDLDKYLAEPVSIGLEVKIIDSGIQGTVLEQKGEKYLLALGGNMTALMDRNKFVRATADIGDKPKRKVRRKVSTKKEAGPKKETKVSAKENSENSKAATTKQAQGSKSNEAKPSKKESPSTKASKKAGGKEEDEGLKTSQLAKKGWNVSASRPGKQGKPSKKALQSKHGEIEAASKSDSKAKSKPIDANKIADELGARKDEEGKKEESLDVEKLADLGWNISPARKSKANSSKK